MSEQDGSSPPRAPAASGSPAGDEDPHSRRRSRRLRIVLAASAVLAAVVVGVGVYLDHLIHDTPNIDDLRSVRLARPSVLLAANGEVLATFRRAQQEPVRLDQISPQVVKALLATEDQRFYAHHGIDVRRLVSAALHTLLGDPQGGSTLTQQLTRNVFPEEIGRARTVDRKLREIITALRIERVYTKDEILAMYLNTVPFLYNVVGIEMAARTYFGRSAAELDVLQSATLVGMLKATYAYNPVLHPERARARRNVVLAQMVKQQTLTDGEYRRLREAPMRVTLTRQDEALGEAPHFAAFVRRWLNDWAERQGMDVYTDGLVIQTTIDPRLQEAATRAVQTQTALLQTIAEVEWGQRSGAMLASSPAAYAALRKKVQPFGHFWATHADLLDSFVRETEAYRKLRDSGKDDARALAGLKADPGFMEALRAEKTRLEAGFVAIDPATGAIKAWVGSRDFDQDQFDHVALAARQPGSTFKPMVYGAALEAGLGPDRSYVDGPVEIRTAEGRLWRPTDMGGYTGQAFTLRDGLVYSKNTITAQVMQEVGLGRVLRLAKAMGISQSRLDPVPSLALGTSPVTLLEMVDAYSTIARLGQHRPPLWVTRVSDRSGRVLADFGNSPQRVMKEETAVQLIDMMRGVVSRGTGTAVRTRFGIVADIAGKTGTTQNNTDGWFILMHPDLVVGAWVGFNDPRVTMRSNYWGQGGHSAILLVGDFFRDVLKKKLVTAKAQFPQPPEPPPMIAQVPGWSGAFAPGGSAPSGDDVQYGGPPPPPQPASRAPIVIVPRDDADDETPSEEPLSAEALSQSLRGMGRDPETGAR